jgi:hypothetical protein
MVEVGRPTVDELRTKLKRAFVLIPGPAMSPRYIQPSPEPLVDELGKDLAAQVCASNRVLVPHVRIGGSKK